MNKRALKALFLGAALGACSSAVHAVTNNVTADIAVDTTWLGTNTYVLKTVVFVTNGATLTIQPGTIIRGERDTTFGTNNAPGTLVISRGAKIRAMQRIIQMRYSLLVLTRKLDTANQELRRLTSLDGLTGTRRLHDGVDTAGLVEQVLELGTGGRLVINNHCSQHTFPISRTLAQANHTILYLNLAYPSFPATIPHQQDEA